jgi:hypothetical protein
VRKLALILGFCVFLCPAAWSTTQPCAAGTLASYEALGSGGCTIGTDLVSSFANVAGTFGATELDPTAVSVSTTGDSSDPELIFSVNQTATAPQLLETIFTYVISDSVFLQSAISLANSSETVDGAVTDIQNLCAGGAFGADGVDGCTGNALSLLTLDGIQNSDNTSLGSVNSVAVTDDFTLDGGTAGTASGGKFTDTFTAQSSVVTTTPEPANTLPAAVLIVLLFLCQQAQIRTRLRTGKLRNQELRSGKR